MGDTLSAETAALGTQQLRGGACVGQPAAGGQVIQQRIQILRLAGIFIRLGIRQQLAAQFGAAVFATRQVLQGART